MKNVYSILLVSFLSGTENSLLARESGMAHRTSTGDQPQPPGSPDQRQERRVGGKDSVGWGAGCSKTSKSEIPSFPTKGGFRPDAAMGSPWLRCCQCAVNAASLCQGTAGQCPKCAPGRNWWCPGRILRPGACRESTVSFASTWREVRQGQASH